MKRFISFVFMLVLCLTVPFLSACNGGEYTKDDVYKIYTEIKQNDTQNGFLKVNIDTNKVVPAGRSVGEDKAQVFGDVYAYYLDCASGFLFSIFDRKSNADFLSQYSKEEMTTLYNKFNSVYSTLNSLKEEIAIYEETSGNLHYKEVVTKYNLLVDRFFDLNFYFADLYYAKNSFNFSSYSNLRSTGTNLNDYIWYELCVMTRVSFGYELINYVYVNPLGDIHDWLERSIYVKESLSVAKELVPTLKEHNSNLTEYLSSNGSDKTLKSLTNMQIAQNDFLNSYYAFLSAKNLVNFKKYLSFTTDEERQNYLSTLSLENKSYFQIVFNFLQNDYNGYVDVFGQVADYINS